MIDAAGRKATANRVDREAWEFAQLVDETRLDSERRTAEAEAAVAQRAEAEAARQAEEKKAARAVEAEKAERIVAAKQAAKAEKAAELAEDSGRPTTTVQGSEDDAAASAQTQAAADAAKAAEARKAADGKAWLEAVQADNERAAPAATAPAATAPAAVGEPWATLVQCEASGNWSMNSGNGYYGGLQFHIGTWRSHGGVGMPHENSPAQQIEVAKRVQASQGWGAWPACSRKAGLR